jgi:hypothetical protein
VHSSPAAFDEYSKVIHDPEFPKKLAAAQANPKSPEATELLTRLVNFITLSASKICAKADSDSDSNDACSAARRRGAASRTIGDATGKRGERPGDLERGEGGGGDDNNEMHCDECA